jgi:IS5 family transposase
VVFRPEGAVGVDSRSKLIYAVVATPVNVADSTVLADLLHGAETRVWNDQAYRGQKVIISQNAPRARDFINRRYRHRGVVDETERARNRTKSKVRARVEHPIGVIKSSASSSHRRAHKKAPGVSRGQFERIAKKYQTVARLFMRDPMFLREIAVLTPDVSHMSVRIPDRASAIRQVYVSGPPKNPLIEDA